MRTLFCSVVLALAAAGTMASTALAATSNENAAQVIAHNLKQSGKLKDYRVGVKYEDGVAWLLGTVTSRQQKQIAEQIARNSAGVDHVISKLEVENPGGSSPSGLVKVSNNTAPQRQPQPKSKPTPRGMNNRVKRNNMPVPYALTNRGGKGVRPANFSQQAQYCPDGTCLPGGGMAGGNGMGMGMGPAPMGPRATGAVGQSVSYDNPQLPGYAWPSYAASPNYAALTYPRQYSPSAWPYIGPFYPYPQVPLGWRKVTLEWDDGWWFLDFKDCKHCK